MECLKWILLKTGVFCIVVLMNTVISASGDIILEEQDLDRFIGRTDMDFSALDRKSVWLDPMIAGSPPVQLNAGPHHFYLFARCMAPVDGMAFVCNMSVVQADTGKVLYQRDVRRREFGDGQAYSTIDWQFECLVPASVRFQANMLIMGKNEFFLDSIGYSGLEGMTRWGNDVLDHHLGVEIDDPLAVTGKTWANSHTLAFGPYLTLPETGRWEAVFRIAIASDFQSDNIGTLDVYSHYGVYDGFTNHKTYAMRGLSTGDFPVPGEFMEFSLPFDYDGAKNLEFRFFVYHVTRNAVRLDRVTVRRVIE